MTEPQPPAIVLGGLETAVPVARSLGRAGIAVHASGGPRDPVRYSRHTTSYSVVEEGDDQARAWLDWLRGSAPRGVLMPVCDAGIELVAHHADELRELGHVTGEQRPEVVLAMLDKAATYAVADRAGVPRPWTRRIDPSDPRTPDDVTFPCAVKPLSTHRFVALTGITEKLLVATGPAELDALLARTAGVGADVFVTEIVPGGDDRLPSYFTYLDAGGEPLFEFTVRKIRQEAPHFGVGCYVIAEWDPQIAELGLHLARAAGLVGPAQIEFKRDARSGEPKLMECNHRISLLVQLLRVSGIDLPLLVHRRATGARSLPAPTPVYGARLWHPLPDYRAMRVLRSEGELTTRTWLRSLMHPLHFTVWDPRDPRPTLVDTGRHIARLARRALRRSRQPRLTPAPADTC